MENGKSNKERKLIWLLIATWVMAATLGGCVISLNIQKNNSDSEQKVEQNLCETTEKIGKMGEAAQAEETYTEALHGVIMLRKGRLEDKEVWFGTVGNQLVSDGAFKTKKELIENLEKVTLERLCKVVAGAFERAIMYREDKK